MKRYELDHYKETLAYYSEPDLRYKYTPTIWSIGQMYDHIILVANEYLDEVDRCLQEDGQLGGGKTPFGERLFREGGFPPIKIELPPEMNQPPNNTDSHDRLRERLLTLISRMEALESRLDDAGDNQKTLHGGFGWLNAREWFELVEMHTRHHRRQQHELEKWLQQKDL
ncbi:DinB family protein [Exiguobacterium aestuarii]|uniref:DinB family protein n=1 Tax=Exiguobacterium aestuarii TaxID=273527 RepID=A0ABW2PRG0_9BACL|nr:MULTISPECIES: DinB family protein [Exiguobacterium]MCT4787377.1 DinB family protein [Exiguobacterium aestuarii]